MGTRTKAMVTMTVAVAASLAASGPALGAAQISTHVTLKIKDGAKFHGRVSSAYDDCVVGRKVQIWRDDSGLDTRVEKTFASESGRYSVKIPMQSGNNFYARVPQYTSPLGTNCGPDHSSEVTA